MRAIPAHANIIGAGISVIAVNVIILTIATDTNISCTIVTIIAIKRSISASCCRVAGVRGAGVAIIAVNLGEDTSG